MQKRVGQRRGGRARMKCPATGEVQTCSTRGDPNPNPSQSLLPLAGNKPCPYPSNSLSSPNIIHSLTLGPRLPLSIDRPLQPSFMEAPSVPLPLRSLPLTRPPGRRSSILLTPCILPLFKTLSPIRPDKLVLILEPIGKVNSLSRGVTPFLPCTLLRNES